MLIFLIGCQNKNAPLNKVVNDIEESWTERQLKDFSQKSESDALSDVHFGYGIYFRNKILRSSTDSTLVKYFNSLNVYDEDYMSTIVFTSLHRKLNNKPINLENQLNAVHSIMANIKKHKKVNSLRAIKYYNNYNSGDTIVIRMPVSKENNAFRYSFPDDSGWVYNDSLDLLIGGVITEKPKYKDSLDMFFKLKILSINHDNIQLLMNEVKIGDTIESDFNHDIIEDFSNSRH